jgi:hypothetical protein
MAWMKCASWARTCDRLKARGARPHVRGNKNMKNVLRGAVLLLAGLAGGCIPHPIDRDYPGYLAANEGKVTLPKVPAAAEYRLDEETLAYNYSVWGWMTGMGNLWRISVGRMLELRLHSADLAKSFQSLRPASGDTSGLVLAFHLVDFEIERYHAELDVEVTATRGGKELLRKTYHAKGISRAAQVINGGAFATKDALTDTTHSAIDEVLKQLLTDLAGQGLSR